MNSNFIRFVDLNYKKFGTNSDYSIFTKLQKILVLSQTQKCKLTNNIDAKK